jgi:hypothetical protein
MLLSRFAAVLLAGAAIQSSTWIPEELPGKATAQLAKSRVRSRRGIC